MVKYPFAAIKPQVRGHFAVDHMDPPMWSTVVNGRQNRRSEALFALTTWFRGLREPLAHPVGQADEPARSSCADRPSGSTSVVGLTLARPPSGTRVGQVGH